MKKIEAIIRPEKLELLMLQLEEVGYPGMMVTEIRGHGKQRGMKHQWRGTEYKTSFIPKIKLEIVTTNNQVKKLVDTITEVCRSGTVGDGKIFVTSIDEAVRIRTGESGDGSLS